MIRKSTTSLCFIILGNALYALAVQLFLVPSGLITGGSTGIALAANSLLHIPVSAFVFAFNLAMLILGYLVLGRKFAMTTILSTFVYPLSLGIFERIFSNVTLTDNMMLNAVFAGLGIGLSLGLVIREGASTGGMDIPPLILNKKFNISVSVSMYAFDFLILLMQAVMHSPEDILYGIIVVLIYTITLDSMLMKGASRTEVRIISPHVEEIRDQILTRMDRGVTLLHGQGGYDRNDKDMLMSIISNRELPVIESIAREIDPACFMIISRVSEVEGRGFSMEKQYQNHNTQTV